MTEKYLDLETYSRYSDFLIIYLSRIDLKLFLKERKVYFKKLALADEREKVKEILEEMKNHEKNYEVDEKYFLSEKAISKMQIRSKEQKKKGNGHRFIPKIVNDIAGTITTRYRDSLDDNYLVEYDSYGISLKASNGSDNIPKIFDDAKIRKLTPLECWRLMDYTDKDFHKAEKVNSNTQLYKQAGNGIVKAVLMAIFGQLLGKE